MSKQKSDGAKALVSAAQLALVLAVAGLQRAEAQTLTGDTNPVPPTAGADLQIGINGGGSMSVPGGVHVINANGTIGVNGAGNGQVTVSGGTAWWENTGDLKVGDAGSGSLQIDSGAKVSDANAYVSGPGRGDVTVTGAGSTWVNAGQLTISESGLGTMLIAAGAQVSNATGSIGSNNTGGGQVTVTGSGSSWTNTDTLAIGNGTLLVKSGGAVSTLGAILGDGGPVHGDATVTGAGSTWTDGSTMYIGSQSSGTLLVDDGATVSGAFATIGSATGVTGGATVSGGASWGNSTGLTVGDSGSGSLLIETGATVSGGSATLGASSGGQGNATVTGAGSSWRNSSGLAVGSFGIGSLLIESGATVSNADGAVGSSSGGQGNVTVTGGGTTWTSTGQLAVGNFGSGTLLVEAGATVTSNQGFIGAASGVSGNVTVTGAGSSWVSNLDINIGNNGTGTLTIQDGGLVQAPAGVELGFTDPASSGTLLLQGTAANPAVLETTGISVGPGAASVTVDGGTLRALSSNATFFSNFGARDVTIGGNGAVIDTNGFDIGIDPRLVGTGGLVKAGAGALTLTGNNTYGGATDVQAGQLEIDGDQTGATGTTTVRAGATLRGGGTVGGGVDVIGGIIAPGTAAAPGTLTIGSALTLDAASTLTYRLGQAGTPGGTLNDLLVVNGNLTLGGTLNVTQSAGGTFGPGIYRLIGYTGTLTDNGLALGTLPAGGTNTVQTSIGNQVNLVNTAAPPGGGGGVTPSVFNFWDNADSVANGVISGGSGVWRASAVNWTTSPGDTDGSFTSGSFAVFAAQAGTVRVDASDGPIAVSGMQFASDGYKIVGDAVSLGAGDAIIRVGDGTAAGASFTATIDSQLIGPGRLDKTDAGTLILTGADNYTGGTQVSGGTLQVGNGGTTGSIAGDVAVDGALAFNRSDDVTFGGVISGGGKIVQAGSGTLGLTADSSAFTGLTQVQNGTLAVDGSLGGAVQVQTGARLTGIGTVGGVDVTGGTIAPGTAAAPGMLTINGALTLDAASSLDYRLGQAGTPGGALNDLLVVNGNLTLGGTLNVTQSAGGTFGPGIYRLIDYTGTLTDNGLALGTLPSGGTNTVQTSVANEVNLVNAASSPNVFNFWDNADSVANGVISGGNGVWRASLVNWTTSAGDKEGAFTSGSFAIFTAQAGTVRVDASGGPIVVSGMQFASDGYKIVGDAVSLGAGDAIIRVGDGTAKGASFTATIDSQLTGAGRLDKTDAGTLILTGADNYTGGTHVGGGTVQVGNGGITGSIAGDVAVDGTLAFNRSDDVTFGGVISGGGKIAQAGSGTLSLTADSSAFTGLTQVQKGTLAVDGSLGGMVEIMGGARLTGVGTVGSLLNHAGGVVAPGHGVGTLTVAGDYTGAGGGLEMEAELGGDASAADRLVVHGGTSGSTLVDVKRLGGTGAVTTDGILLVQVGGASNGVFTLANGDYRLGGENALVAGAYAYVLRKDAGDGDWRLRSSVTALPGTPSSGGTDQPGTPGVTIDGPTKVTLYQPGTPLYEAYPQVLQVLNDMGTMRQRIGDRQWSGQEGEGVWGRAEGGHAQLENAVTTTQADLKLDHWKMQFGIDHTLASDLGGGQLVGGLTAQYGQVVATVASPFGGGDIDTKGYGVGATATWTNAAGVYIDAQTQMSWFGSDLSSQVLGARANGADGDGYALSIEAGKAMAAMDGLTLTPQMQLSYSKVNFDSITDSFGARVSADRGDSLVGRLGLALDHAWTSEDFGGKGQIYGLVNLKQEFLDGLQVDVSGAPVASRPAHSWGGLAAGGTYAWGDGRYMIYGETTIDTSLAQFGNSYSLGGSAGIRMRF